MIDKQFEKEEFKKSVKENVKFLYGPCPWKQPDQPWCIRRG